jgi:hypothetical protein
VIAELGAVNAEQARLIAALQSRVAELERRLGKDSSNSSMPPSSDGLRKPTRAERRGDHGAARGRPGKQPGAPGAHLAQVAEPDEVVEHAPDRCGECGATLDGAVVVGGSPTQTASTWCSASTPCTTCPTWMARSTTSDGLTRPAGLVVLADCVARRPTLPRWWFVGGAVRDLLVDLARRPALAGELFRLRTDPPGSTI